MTQVVSSSRNLIYLPEVQLDKLHLSFESVNLGVCRSFRVDQSKKYHEKFKYEHT